MARFFVLIGCGPLALVNPKDFGILLATATFLWLLVFVMMSLESIHVDSEGIIYRKGFRERRVRWDEVRHVESKWHTGFDSLGSSYGASVPNGLLVFRGHSGRVLLRAAINIGPPETRVQVRDFLARKLAGRIVSMHNPAALGRHV